MKRFSDLLLAFVLFLLSAPFMIAISILILLIDGRPFLFKQVRPGLNERPFTLYKFRTMTNAKSPTGEPLPDEMRLTRLGAILRKLSLDELPQLINVIKGDMSLVGPRPLLMEYLPLYSERQRMRHLVKPGITGWAQVNGRNALDWQSRLEMDVWYVQNRSFWLDLKILLMTILKVLKREGISKEGFATMPRFTGNNT